MSSWLVLKLDTRAPQVTWGPVDGAIASEEMTVPYLLDEPGPVSATFTLKDGRELDMVVAADRLTVVLPDDAPDGTGVVSFTVEDSLLNRAVRTLRVPVNGVGDSVEVPVPPMGWPGKVKPRLFQSETKGTGAQRYRVTAVVSSTSRAYGRTRFLFPSFKTHRTYEESTGRQVYGVAAFTRLPRNAVASSDTIEVVRRQPEGPEAEDELIVLDLL